MLDAERAVSLRRRRGAAKQGATVLSESTVGAGTTRILGVQSFLSLQLSDLLYVDAISEYKRFATFTITVRSFFWLQIVD